MNTNKIREALELSRKVGVMMDWDDIRDKCEEALAELDKAPQALTDEECKSEAMRRYGPGLYLPEDPRHALRPAVAFYACYEWLRDNGYLAPSIGLTVEEAMEVARKTDKDWHDYYDDEEFWSDLRARLTAAIEAKKRKQ